MKRKMFNWSIILEVLIGIIMATLSFEGFGTVVFWLLLPIGFFAIFSLLLLVPSSSDNMVGVLFEACIAAEVVSAIALIAAPDQDASFFMVSTIIFLIASTYLLRNVNKQKKTL